MEFWTYFLFHWKIDKHRRMKSYILVLAFLFKIYFFHWYCPSLAVPPPGQSVHVFQDPPSRRGLLQPVGIAVLPNLSLSIYAYLVLGNLHLHVSTLSCIRYLSIFSHPYWKAYIHRALFFHFCEIVTPWWHEIH